MKYEILEGLRWIKVKKGEQYPSGWLSYELRDGTTGMKRPGEWRKILQDKRHLIRS